MITYSSLITPTPMRSGTHFAAKQYALSGMAGPVLNIDAFDMRGPTFPAHPHAGFSAITYIFAESPGGFINKDSLGNKLFLEPGSTHWTRASSGIIHEEYPEDNAKPVRGLQIFFNLPDADQDESPAAFHVAPNQVKTTQHASGVKIRESVSGTAIGGREALSKAAYIAEISLPENETHRLPIMSNFSGAILVIEGQVTVDELEHQADQAVALRSDEQAHITLTSPQSRSRVVIIGGEHFEQGIFQKGPFITATEQRLKDSIRRYQLGEFGTIAD